MSDKIPLGTRVQYHGSMPHDYVEYTIDGYSDFSLRTDLTPEQIAEHWPDGVAYDLWPVDVPHKFGLRDTSILFVRRESFDVIYG